MGFGRYLLNLYILNVLMFWTVIINEEFTLVTDSMYFAAFVYRLTASKRDTDNFYKYVNENKNVVGVKL